MSRIWTRLAFALAAPMMLASCFVSPGKFVSTLFVGADRSFTFTYTGEVIAVDFAREFNDGMRRGSEPATTPSETGFTRLAFQQAPPPKIETAPKSKADSDAKFRAMAEALRQEPGYRRVEYKGEGVFEIDYSISGTLSHNFVFPFNADAEIVFPFVLVELRSGGMVRVKAPGFADEDSSSSMMGDMAKGKSRRQRPAERLDGQFTLTTDAEIVSQNTERAPGTDAQGRRTLNWRATPLTRTAPLAVMRLAAQP